MPTPRPEEGNVLPSRSLARVLTRVLALWLLALLAGCATQALPLPEPSALRLDSLGLPRHVLVTQVPTANEAAQPPWQVVAQQENQALRWSRFDLLGVPDARQMLEHGRWRNDGFIAPNAPAREMFAALLFAWVSQSDPAAQYGASHWRVLWSADATHDDVFSIVRLQDGVRWDVRPINETPSKDG